MDVVQELDERIEVVTLVWSWHVLGHNDRHALVVIKTGIKSHVLALRGAQPVETNRMVEVREVVPHRHGGRGEHHALHLGQPLLGKVSTHIELLGKELLSAYAPLGAVQLRGVHVRLVLSAQDEPKALEQLGDKAS